MILENQKLTVSAYTLILEMDNNFSSAKTLVAETVGEEINEERVKIDIKNPGELMKEMSKRTLVEKMREEAERTMAETVGEEMKEEGTQVDIKNLQMAEMDIDFPSAKGTMGEETRRMGRRWILISHW
ncbi:hypothetical protein KY290_019247 [Solanum tuberosum]|uniref:Uncharacterized protein n=1 Tax=Solanum tuberosum TaxID=4113 RepID=A0ABQ7VGJ1_SOLTU|nr:hypothetical protein KY290_019247 [Solanum tuberosum]